MTEIIEKPVQGSDYDIDAFLGKRREFIEKVNAIMVEGSDYHVMTQGGRSRKSLAKGGAEKIASIFGWQSEFRKDEDVMGSFKLDGLIAFVCDLRKGGEFVGQGRGAATLGKNAGDPNKTIKMAQKSAFIDAVLRSSGLSDFFTQDLGPEDEGSSYNHLSKDRNPGDAGQQGDFEGAPKAVAPATEKQKAFIRTLMQDKGVTKLSELGLGEKDLTAEYASQIIDKLLKYQRPSGAAVPEIQVGVDTPY